MTQQLILAGSPPGAAAFSPLALTDLRVWLDSADSATITESSGVTQWADKSGNARHFGNGTGKPTKYTDGSYQTIKMYGSNQCIYRANEAGLQPSAGGFLFAVSINMVTSGYYSYWISTDGTSDSKSFGLKGNNSNEYLTCPVNATNVQKASSTTGKHTIIVRYSKADGHIKMYVDNGTTATATTTYSTDVVAQTAAMVLGGSTSGGANSTYGYWYEFVYCGSPGTTTDVSNLYTYLKTKNGTP